MNNATLALAQEFTRILHTWLTPTEMAEVVKRNATPKYKGCCATHDFCDANMAMDEAMRNLDIATPCDLSDSEPQHEEACVLWNEAWDYAKSQNFSR